MLFHTLLLRLKMLKFNIAFSASVSTSSQDLKPLEFRCNSKLFAPNCQLPDLHWLCSRVCPICDGDGARQVRVWLRCSHLLTSQSAISHPSCTSADAIPRKMNHVRKKPLNCLFAPFRRLFTLVSLSIAIMKEHQIQAKVAGGRKIRRGERLNSHLFS